MCWWDFQHHCVGLTVVYYDHTRVLFMSSWFWFWASVANKKICSVTNIDHRMCSFHQQNGAALDLLTCRYYFYSCSKHQNEVQQLNLLLISMFAQLSATILPHNTLLIQLTYLKHQKWLRAAMREHPPMPAHVENWLQLKPWNSI